MIPRIGGMLDGEYRLVERLGKGGQGTVYKVENKYHNDYAVKFLILRSKHAEQDRERFRREAEALRNAQHPHIVRIYKLRDTADPPYLVMDYIDGMSLREILDARQNAPLELRDAVAIAYQVGGALHESSRILGVTLAKEDLLR